MGNGEPNIGFVTADDELDEMAILNTNNSGEYKQPDPVVAIATPRNRLVYVSVSFFHSVYRNVASFHFVRTASALQSEHLNKQL